MGSLDEERAQIMILRAWTEAEGHNLRVRVTRVNQDGAGEPAISAAATIDGVCAIVRTWLEGFLGETDWCYVEPGPGIPGVTLT